MRKFHIMPELKLQQLCHVTTSVLWIDSPCVWSWLFVCLSVCQQTDWRSSSSVWKQLSLSWSEACFFSSCSSCVLIGWLGLFPGILVTQGPADVTALHYEVWVYLAASVNKQAGTFTGDNSHNEGHICHDVIEGEEETLSCSRS